MKCVNERMVYQIEISSKFPRELQLVINLLWPIDCDEFWQKQNHRMVIEQKMFVFCLKICRSVSERAFPARKERYSFYRLVYLSNVFSLFLTASLAK